MIFEKLQDVIIFNTPLPKKELEKDLTEDGFTTIVTDNGKDRTVTAISYKIDKTKN